MDEFLKTMGIDTNGISYDQMSKAEKETLDQWLDALKKNELTLDHVRQYIRSLKDAVENELADEPETERVWLFFTRSSRKAVLMKARMKNYMLLEAFLMTPERAKRQLEKALKGLSN